MLCVQGPRHTVTIAEKSSSGPDFLQRLSADSTRWERINPLALRKSELGELKPFWVLKAIRLFRFIMLWRFCLFFRGDSLPKYDTIDAVPTQLEPEFRTPGRVLQEIRPLDPNTTDSPDGPVKQNLEFRFSVGQLPSWAQKRVSGIYSKTCVKWSRKNRRNKELNDKW